MLSRRPWAYERGTLWAMDIDGDALDSVVPPHAATLGEVQHEIQAEEALATAMGLSSIAPVTQRFGAGSRCFAAWVAAGIAAYGWVSEEVERIGELERPFHMENGEAYIWELRDPTSLPPAGSLLYAASSYHRHTSGQRDCVDCGLAHRCITNRRFEDLLQLDSSRLST